MSQQTDSPGDYQLGVLHGQILTRLDAWDTRWQEHVDGAEDFKKEVKEFTEFVKTSPPAEGFTEVLYPGEPEYLTEQKRRAEGIFIEDETWNKITELMQGLGVEETVGQPT